MMVIKSKPGELQLLESYAESLKEIETTKAKMAEMLIGKITVYENEGRYYCSIYVAENIKE